MEVPDVVWGFLVYFLIMGSVNHLLSAYQKWVEIRARRKQERQMKQARRDLRGHPPLSDPDG